MDQESPSSYLIAKSIHDATEGSRIAARKSRSQQRLDVFLGCILRHARGTTDGFVNEAKIPP